MKFFTAVINEPDLKLLKGDFSQEFSEQKAIDWIVENSPTSLKDMSKLSGGDEVLVLSFEGISVVPESPNVSKPVKPTYRLFRVKEEGE